jgi:KRAB domain-containing zinc finger protein
VHAQKKHSCDICGKLFVNKRALKTHSFTHSSVPQFECAECHKKYRSKRGVHGHTKFIHLCIKFKCDLCGKFFPTKYSLSKHNKFVHDNGEIVRLKCEFCQGTFKGRINLVQHWKNIHLNPKKVTCGICHKIMLDRETLRDHKRNMHRPKLEHPDKLEEEQNDALICGLPAPDTETSDQEQPQDIGV